MARKIVYHLSVYALMPIAGDADDNENLDMHSLFLKRSDYDCDVELMDFSVEDE